MSMYKSHRIVLFLPLLLCACITSPNRTPNPPSPVIEHGKPETDASADRPVFSGTIFDREKHTAEALLAYGKRFIELTPDLQKKELAQVTQVLGRNRKDTLTRMKSAMIFCLPGSRYRDSARASSLLGDLQREKLKDDDVNALIVVLKGYAEEQQRFEDANARLTQKFKDEQQRADELQQKLDALKNIEKTMIDRGQTK